MTTPSQLTAESHPHTPCNKGALVGQKKPLKLKEIWAIRTKLQMAHKISDLAAFNLAIDSKLRGCDLVSLRVHDVSNGSHVQSRAMVIQKRAPRQTLWVAEGGE